MLVLDIEGEAERTGRYAAAAVPFLLLLLGVVKSFSIARRPATNTKCAVALALVFLAWMMFTIVGVAVKQDPGTRSWMFLVGLGAFVVVIVSIVLAILGLVELKQNPERFSQGKAQGIWSLVICGVFVALFSFGFVSQMQAKDRVPEHLKVDQKNPGTLLEFPELMFTFQAPERPWVQINAKKLNPIASLALYRGSPQQFMMIVAEKLPSGYEVDLDTLAEVVKANLESVSSAVRFETEEAESYAGVEGIRMVSEVRMENQTLSYIHWIVLKDGYFYQLIAWAGLPHKEALLKEFPTVRKGFSFIQPVKDF